MIWFVKYVEGDVLKIALESTDILNSFDLLLTKTIDKYQRDKLNVFALKINANEFNYRNLEEQLIDPLIDYSISREVKREYSDKPGRLSKKAREKFKEYSKNDGELGELLLFCFLEAHLNAPKILSKLELKTSTSLYVNGADGVHFRKLPDGNFQLIFGESKMYADIKLAFNRALESIYEFKNEINGKETSKSGICYEKSLISDNLSKETFSEEEKFFLKSLIYPSEKQTFYVDDAFGVFVGFEIIVNDEEKELPNHAFRKLIHNRIITNVKQNFEEIYGKIKELGLHGHDFYIYVLPFTEIDIKRKDVLKEALSWALYKSWSMLH